MDYRKLTYILVYCMVLQVIRTAEDIEIDDEISNEKYEVADGTHYMVTWDGRTLSENVTITFHRKYDTSVICLTLDLYDVTDCEFHFTYWSIECSCETAYVPETCEEDKDVNVSFSKAGQSFSNVQLSIQGKAKDTPNYAHILGAIVGILVVLGIIHHVRKGQVCNRQKAPSAAAAPLRTATPPANPEDACGHLSQPADCSMINVSAEIVPSAPEAEFPTNPDDVELKMNQNPSAPPPSYESLFPSRY